MYDLLLGTMCYRVKLHTNKFLRDISLEITASWDLIDFKLSRSRLDLKKQEFFIISCQTFQMQNSHRRCSIKKDVLRNFAKFTGEHLYQSLFFNKVAGLGPATLLKKRLFHRCFPVNFAKYLRTRFLQNTSGRLPLQMEIPLILVI